MAVAVITGSAGLIGAEAARFFAEKGLDIVGVDNDMRRQFFGEEASTAWNRQRFETELKAYRHYDMDIRDQNAVSRLFERYGTGVVVVIHTAAQPSHDWAAKAPLVDFSINAGGTLNLLEATRTIQPGRVLHFYQHQQSLWRHAQSVATRRATHPLGAPRQPSLWATRDR